MNETQQYVIRHAAYVKLFPNYCRYCNGTGYLSNGPMCRTCLGQGDCPQCGEKVGVGKEQHIECLKCGWARNRYLMPEEPIAHFIKYEPFDLEGDSSEDDDTWDTNWYD